MPKYFWTLWKSGSSYPLELIPFGYLLKGQRDNEMIWGERDRHLVRFKGCLSVVKEDGADYTCTRNKYNKYNKNVLE